MPPPALPESRIISDSSKTKVNTIGWLLLSESHVVSTDTETRYGAKTSVSRSESHIVSTDTEASAASFGLWPGVSLRSHPKKQASRFADPAHLCVLRGLHARQFPHPPRY